MYNVNFSTFSLKKCNPIFYFPQYIHNILFFNQSKPHFFSLRYNSHECGVIEKKNIQMLEFLFHFFPYKNIHKIFHGEEIISIALFTKKIQVNIIFLQIHALKKIERVKECEFAS